MNFRVIMEYLPVSYHNFKPNASRYSDIPYMEATTKTQQLDIWCSWNLAASRSPQVSVTDCCGDDCNCPSEAQNKQKRVKSIKPQRDRYKCLGLLTGGDLYLSLSTYPYPRDLSSMKLAPTTLLEFEYATSILPSADPWECNSLPTFGLNV